MKVILIKDVENLGEEGDIVTVKDGFGRNYLIPQGLARLATGGTIKARQEEMRQATRRRERERTGAEAIAKELENTEVVISVKVGEENRIFGTVTSQQLTVELNKRGFDIDRRNVEFEEEIRMVGVYTANVKLHKNVTAQVKVRVIPASGPIEV